MYKAETMFQLKLLKLLYELQPIKVTVLRSYGATLPVLDSSLQKGSQTLLPRIIAETLEDHGIVETVENIVSQQDLAKAKFSHMQQRGSIPKVDEFFYTKVKKSVEKLMSKARLEGDIVLLRNVEKMRGDFLDILNIRITSIFRAFQLRGVDILEKNCSIEEKVLINSVKSVYDNWVREYAET